MADNNSGNNSKPHKVTNKEAAKVISLELKQQANPHRTRNREEDAKLRYILGHIKFLHLDSSDMGLREREYALINHDEDPGFILDKVTKEWNLGAPKLVISLMGGYRKCDHLTTSTQNTFRRELVNSILSTGAWLTTGGLHSGMIREVGEALREYAIGRAMVEHRSVVVLGVAPLSILKHRQKLTAMSTQAKPIKYKIDATTGQLDPNHTHFIVVDDEGMDKTGSEIDMQNKLLKEIAGQMIEGSSTAGIPVVCIVIGGGYRRIKAVHETVVENKIPVIILEGTGGAADVLAYAAKHMNAKDAISKNGGLSWSLTASLSRVMAKTISSFNKILKEQFGEDKIGGDNLLDWCREIAERKDLITVLSLNSTDSDIEETILSALLKATKSGNQQYEDQLHLAVVLDRLELAQQLLKDETSLNSSTVIRQTIRFSLVHDQVKFVELFLRKGLNLQEYLTPRELTSLYKMTSKDTLLYELLDTELEDRGRRLISRWVTLRDVGNVIHKLSDRSYQPLYLKDDIAAHTYGFPEPSRELFLWAVLQGRLEMADLFWRESKAPIGGALVASKLLKEMAKREQSLHESRRGTKYEEGGSLYEKLAVEVLDECYLSDRNRTSLIIVRRLASWGNSNCLDLANSANNMKFIAHASVQNMLKEFWNGKLSLLNPTWKLALCFAFPPLLLFMNLKLKEEESDPLLVKSLPRGTSKGTILIRKRENRTSFVGPPRSRKWLPFLPRGISRDEGLTDDATTGLPGRRPGHSELNRRKAVKQGDKRKDVETKPSISRMRRIRVFFLVPSVIFFYNVVSTLSFLTIFSYVLLVCLDTDKPWPVEYVLLGWFFTLCTEIVRQIYSQDAVGLRKFNLWISYFWNKIDILKSIIFIIGYALRILSALPMFADKKNAARILLAMALIVFYMRLLPIFSVNKHLGPKLIMIQKMFADLLVFLCILLVFLIAYGVSSEAILHTQRKNVTTAAVFESIIYRPYIQMFGEGLLEDADNSECMKDMGEDCPDNVWFGTVLLAMYLFLSNVLLLNLLIAMFNYTFTAVQENTDVYWKYQRYLLIKEYYKRPFLPPPFIIFIHMWLFCRGFFKCLLCTCQRCKKSLDCCRERRVFESDLPPLTQANVLEMETWESVKGEDYLEKQRELEQHDMDKRLINTDRRINELTDNVTRIAQNMNVIHSTLENMQQLLLEKLGHPRNDDSDEFLDEIPDGPTLALYEQSGRRSSREISSRAQKLWQNASKLTKSNAAKLKTNEAKNRRTSVLARQNAHEAKSPPTLKDANDEMETYLKKKDKEGGLVSKEQSTVEEIQSNGHVTDYLMEDANMETEMGNT